MDKFLKSNLLCGFIDRLFDYVSESKAWEYWLCRETGMNWENFRLAVIPQKADLSNMVLAEADFEKELSKGVIANGAF